MTEHRLCRLTWKADPPCEAWRWDYHGCHNRRDHHHGRCQCACGAVMPRGTGYRLKGN